MRRRCTLIGVNAVGVQSVGGGLATRRRWHRRVAVHCNGRRQSRYRCGCDGRWRAGTCAHQGFHWMNCRGAQEQRAIFKTGWICYMRVGFCFFLFFLLLSSFETNANYANGLVMTTLPVWRSRNPGESLTPDVLRVLFNETQCSRLCTKPPKYTLTGCPSGRWEKKREMDLLTTECGVFSARESGFLEREPQDSFVTCIFNTLDGHLIQLYLRQESEQLTLNKRHKWT